jgi:hypothetical protein
MRLKVRLERLEVKQVRAHPSLVFLTPQGLRDVHDRPVSPEAAENAKVIVGIDPRDL